MSQEDQLLLDLPQPKLTLQQILAQKLGAAAAQQKLPVKQEQEEEKHFKPRPDLYKDQKETFPYHLFLAPILRNPPIHDYRERICSGYILWLTDSISLAYAQPAKSLDLDRLAVLMYPLFRITSRIDLSYASWFLSDLTFIPFCFQDRIEEIVKTEVEARKNLLDQKIAFG